MQIILTCPIDGKPLDLDVQQKNYSCVNGHNFDIAKQGYVNLLPVQHKRSKDPGDSKEMVLARKAFLESGVYQTVANTVEKIITQFSFVDKNIHILDAGCGEGYYLDYLHNTFNKNASTSNYSCLGLDISKLAIMEAAKRNKQIAWIVGTNRAPPVCKNSIDIILCVFGFYNFDGFNKVLKSAGKVILVEPNIDHLKELREVIYSDVKKTSPPELSMATALGFTITDTQHIKYRTGKINKQQIDQLLLMTPHFFRANKEGRERASNLDNLDLTVDMVVRVLEKEQ